MHLRQSLFVELDVSAHERLLLSMVNEIYTDINHDGALLDPIGTHESRHTRCRYHDVRFADVLCKHLWWRESECDASKCVERVEQKIQWLPNDVASTDYQHALASNCFSRPENFLKNPDDSEWGARDEERIVLLQSEAADIVRMQAVHVLFGTD